MILFIDAYNVLKRHSAHEISSKERARFLTLIQHYARLKNHRLIVVFDGGLSPWPTVYNQGQVQIVYAGNASQADEYIKKALPRYSQEGTLLVTSDRHLGDYAALLGIVVVKAAKFATIVQQTVDESSELVKSINNQVQKMTAATNDEIDLLMIQEKITVKPIDISSSDTPDIKNKKSDRKKRRHLKKL